MASKYRLFHGDCLDIMFKIPDGKIDMIITSPPYDDMRKYNDGLVWNEKIWKSVLLELYRIIKMGSVLIWIVGDKTIDGSETGSSFKQALYGIECGFKLNDTMIWKKDTFTDVGSLKNRYAQVYDYMFVFSKGKLNIFNPIKDRINKYAGYKIHGHNVLPDGSRRPVSNTKIINYFGIRHNVWNIPSEKNNKTGHPAVFPIKLVKDHIISWSNTGNIILDPFMGSGTTGVACMNLNRKFIGIEKDEKYFEIAKERIENA